MPENFKLKIISYTIHQRETVIYRGISLMRNAHPLRTAIGAQA